MLIGGPLVFGWQQRSARLASEAKGRIIEEQRLELVGKNAELAQALDALGLAALGLIGLLVLPPRTPWAIVRSGPLYLQPITGEIVHHAVGRNATVLLTESEGWWSLSSSTVF